MKLVPFVAVFAFAIACILACDPDGNNRPVCSQDNLNVKIRNFWDPTHYWLCESAGAEASSVSCGNQTAFNSTIGECVPWNQWQWTPPCPEDRP